MHSQQFDQLHGQNVLNEIVEEEVVSQVKLLKIKEIEMQVDLLNTMSLSVIFNKGLKPLDGKQINKLPDVFSLWVESAVD